MATAVIARVSGRIAAGLVGAAVAAVVVGAAFALPVKNSDVGASPLLVTPVPTDATAVCPGPLLDIDSDTATTTTRSFANTTAIAGGTSELGDPVILKTPDDAQKGHTGPQVFSAPAAKGAKHAPLLGAAQSQQASETDVSGFAAASCPEPAADSWLVAGATSLGQNSLVLLSNPGGVAATVDLAVYDEQGAVNAPGASGILVAAHAQKVVPLAGLAPDASATVVHVTATGGSVVADLEQSTISGITPLGVELAGQTAPPSTHLVIPGMTVTASAATADAASDDSDGSPVLRVLVPGAKPAKLSIGLAAEQGAAGGAAQTVTVSAGQVSEIPLQRLADGGYTVTVDSDQPIVAGVRSATAGTTGDADYAWYAAARPLTGSAAVGIADGPSATLHLVNPSGTAAAVAVSGDGYASTKILVKAGASVGYPLPHGGVLTVSGASGLYASVGYSGDGELSGYTVSPPGTDAGALTVYTR